MQTQTAIKDERVGDENEQNNHLGGTQNRTANSSLVTVVKSVKKRRNKKSEEVQHREDRLFIGIQFTVFIIFTDVVCKRYSRLDNTGRKTTPGAFDEDNTTPG